MQKEYRMRREMLMKRLDVTIQSFQVCCFILVICYRWFTFSIIRLTVKNKQERFFINIFFLYIVKGDSEKNI